MRCQCRVVCPNLVPLAIDDWIIPAKVGRMDGWLPACMDGWMWMDVRIDPLITGSVPHFQMTSDGSLFSPSGRGWIGLLIGGIIRRNYPELSTDICAKPIDQLPALPSFRSKNIIHQQESHDIASKWEIMQIRIKVIGTPKWLSIFYANEGLHSRFYSVTLGSLFFCCSLGLMLVSQAANTNKSMRTIRNKRRTAAAPMNNRLLAQLIDPSFRPCKYPIGSFLSTVN